MKLSNVFAALLFALSSAAAATAGAQPPDACTCVMTIVGDYNHKERHCDGFNPATHVQCPCEKVQVNDQLACEPKGRTTESPARASATPLPGS